MIHLAIFAFSLFVGNASAVEPGNYVLEISFTRDSMGYQEIELLNFRPKSNLDGSFDVRVSTKGGLMRFKEDVKFVQGIYYMGTTEVPQPDGRKLIPKFEFMIPKAGVSNVTAFKFIAIDRDSNGVYEGTVEAFGQTERVAKQGPLPFTMKRGAR